MKALAYGLAAVSIWSTSALANPQIDNATLAGKIVTLTGHRFGPRCADCEVVADYGEFKYALPIDSWQAGEIRVALLDLGVGKRASLQIRASSGSSTAVDMPLPTTLIPPQRVRATTAVDSSAEWQIFERSYDLSIGDKGTDSFDVSQPPAACGETAQVFHSAEVVIGRHTRFGDARKVASPPSGCSHCSPVKVRYYFEPTGKLDYQLHVYRREIDGICLERIRH